MLITADRILTDGSLRRDYGFRVGKRGRITAMGPLAQLGKPDRVLEGRVVLPGFVNAHSHCFQRLLRGRTQVAGPAGDDFWTWREAMYRVAGSLDPESLRVVARQAFLEMLLNGVTMVAEFHYVHHQPGGTPYRDPAELAGALISAAEDVGIRLCILRTVYLRGDFDSEPSVGQLRFCDPSLDAALAGIETLYRAIERRADPRVSMGCAAHSVRAMPIEAIVALKTSLTQLPFHIHVSEQRREVESCRARHGRGPVGLLAESGVLDAFTTLVHATHLEPGEARAIKDLGATVCVCPSTESDLGDGLLDASALYRAGVPLCLGTDGQTLSSILEEARRLEMHERLRTQRRNVLVDGEGDSPARAVIEAATVHGARALGVQSGELKVGHWADFVSFDLNEPHLAGLDDGSLLAGIAFSADARAIREVMVGGRFVVEDGRHEATPTCVAAFNQLADQVFRG